MTQFLTLRTKNILAFLCIAFITGIVGVTGYNGMKTLDSKFKIVVESAPLIKSAINMKLAVSQDLLVVMKLMAALDTDELSETWKEHEVFVKQFEQLKNSILNAPKNEAGTLSAAGDKKLNDIVQQSTTYYFNTFQPGYKIIYEQMQKKLSAETYDYNLLDTIDKKTISSGKILENELDKVAKIAEALIAQAENEAVKSKDMSIKITLFATVIGILVAVIMGIVFSGIVTKPIIQTVDFTRGISEGDFRNSLEIYQKDEIGTMASAINKMISNLATNFRDITRGLGTLNETSAELSEVSEELKSQAREMSDKSQAVVAAADEMNQRLSLLATSSEESSSNLDNVSAAIEQMNSTVNEIVKNTGEARAVTQTSVEKAQDASVKVNELGADASEIGKVTDVISEISEQTNLLALNATIEAARAGEAGKGFAVVAGEIKALAQQTAEAARNIKMKIDRIQSSTKGTVTEIQEISAVSGKVDTIVSSIAGAIEEQSITTKEITKNITHAVEGIHEISNNIADTSTAATHIANDISGLNDNSKRVSDSSQHVNDNVLKLTDFAGQLKSMLANFKFKTKKNMNGSGR